MLSNSGDNENFQLLWLYVLHRLALVHRRYCCFMIVFVGKKEIVILLPYCA